MEWLKRLLNREPQMFGFVPNPEQDNDPRNLLYDEIAPLGGLVPEQGDIDKGNWVLNQGSTSSCTTQAACGAFDEARGLQLSPRDAFKEIKSNPKYPSSQLQWGAYMRDSFSLLINEGICEFSLAPNVGIESDQAFLNFKRTDAMEVSARRHKGGSYVYVTSGNDQLAKFEQIIRYMHEQKLPVVVGVDWRGSFNNARRGGVVPAEVPSGGIAGHAMLAVAWKRIDGHEYIGFRNSWGPTWGDEGRIWLPKGFFKISSGLAYLPPKVDVVKPAEIPNADRNTHLEKAKAVELRKMLEEAFPLNVPGGALPANVAARALAGRTWLLIVQAVTYRGWTVIDVKNWLYAHSRNKTTTKAYNLDFTKQK